MVAPTAGVVGSIDARAVGLAAVELGAGRRRVDDPVDPAVGFEFHVGVNDRVEGGQPLVTVHARDERGGEVALDRLASAIEVGDEAGDPPPLILERIASVEAAEEL